MSRTGIPRLDFLIFELSMKTNKNGNSRQKDLDLKRAAFPVVQFGGPPTSSR
jgi:hypothetical protein